LSLFINFIFDELLLIGFTKDSTKIKSGNTRLKSNFFVVKKLHVLLVIFLTIFFTGCIEIVEKITIHKNQSGNIMYSLEPGKFSAFIAGMNDFPNSNPLGSWEDQTVVIADKLRKIEGIDSIEYKFNTETNEYYLKFSFVNVSVLNDAVYGFLDYDQNIFSPDFLKLNRHRLYRKNFVPLLHKYIMTLNFDTSIIDIADLVNFKTVVRMPDRTKSAKGDNCRISEDGVSVIQTHKLSGIIENSVNLGIRIRY